MKARMFWIGGVVVLLLAVGVTFVGAQGEYDFYACVNNASGTIRMIDEGESCPANTEMVHWNQVGPIGPKGPSGPQGDPGEGLPVGCNSNELARWNGETSVWECFAFEEFYTKEDVDLLLSGLEGRISELETKLASVSLENSGQDVIFTGVNVHVRNGTGSTDGINGLGNLIVGYNIDSFGPVASRTGSHNLIIGDEHSYSSYGGFVAGYFNTISGQSSSVCGGQSNTASGWYTSVSGGWYNTASGDRSSISGGYFNEAIGVRSSISGGGSNDAIGENSSICGGKDNLADGYYSSISGGLARTTSGDYDWVAGGLFEDD